MEFEWDENKRQSNLSKHGIDFVDAAKIFDRPVLERLDNRYDYEDTRGVSVAPPVGGIEFAPVFAERA